MAEPKAAKAENSVNREKCDNSIYSMNNTKAQKALKAVIVGGGTPPSEKLVRKRCEGADLIVAADGGADALYLAGLSPHILVGDFDSIRPDTFAFFKAWNVEFHTFPVEKDFTDMELAIRLCLERGAKEVCLLGAVGTRLDHSLANVLMLGMLLDNGVNAWLEDEYNRVYLTRTGMTLKRDKGENRRVSLVAVSETVEGLTTRGLSYPLSNALLKFGGSLGVSNEFDGDTAEITFTRGLLLIMESIELSGD